MSQKLPALRIRVCHAAATVTGARWMFEQLRELRARSGFEVAAIVSEGQGELVEQLAAADIEHSPADFSFGSLADIWSLPRKVRALARTFEREGFDVVQTHLFHSNLIGRVAAWLADVPLRVTMVAGPFHLQAYTPRWIDRATCWMDSVTVASCELTRALYRGMGVPDSRLALVYYGPDARRFDPAQTAPADLAREFGFPAGAPVVGMVSYFYPRLPRTRWVPPSVQDRSVKGHEFLLRAAPLVWQRRPDARFLLVGSGWEEGGERYLGEMRALADDLRLDERVVFAGYRADVPAYLRALDVSVQPSLNENLGGTLESLLMERPTVATRVGGMPDVVREGETGVLAEPADPESLAAAILRLLDQPEQAREMARKGRRLVLDRFALSRTVDDLDRLYRERLLVRGRRRTGYRRHVQVIRHLLLVPVATCLAARLWFDVRVLGGYDPQLPVRHAVARYVRTLVRRVWPFAMPRRLRALGQSVLGLARR